MDIKIALFRILITIWYKWGVYCECFLEPEKLGFGMIVLYPVTIFCELQNLVKFTEDFYFTRAKRKCKTIEVTDGLPA
jgi:hypothetical protein